MVTQEQQIPTLRGYCGATRRIHHVCHSRHDLISIRLRLRL